MAAALLKTLPPLRSDRCPFVNLPSTKKSHWGEGVTPEEMADYISLRPETVAEIKFAEWTTGAVLRLAEFVACATTNPQPKSQEKYES